MRAGLAIVCIALALAAEPAAAGSDAPAVAYPPVLPERVLVFPADYGAHPEFRTEWWYVTGWLRDEAGIERGFQVTFFRVRTGIGEDNPSRFSPKQLILAHAAVADPALGRLRHAERASRAMAPLAGAELGATRVWIGDWVLRLEGERYHARVAAEDFALDLQLEPNGEPVLNGERGFSRKAADPRHASHYYSRPQLAVSGTLYMEGAAHPVAGQAWLDHEWSSGYLPPEARGWDWVGINLADGGSLMAFQMRDAQGAAVWTAGTLREGNRPARALEPTEVSFVPQRRWRSPRTGVEYPVVWLLKIGGRSLRLEPLMDDQELDGRASTGAIYWEGAVRVIEDAAEIGRGYLEMTGYVERLRM